jgi:hypothetical protein
VKELIQANSRIMIDSVASALGCSHDLAYGIMHNCFKFWKVCAWWVPRELKNHEKINRMGLSLQYLLWYANEENMLSSNVTGEKSGVHPTPYRMGTRGSFPGVKRQGREADHSPPTNAEVKKMWIYTSTLPYVFMA